MFGAKALMNRQMEDKIAPAMVTHRQPKRLTNDEDIGPEIEFFINI